MQISFFFLFYFFLQRTAVVTVGGLVVGVEEGCGVTVVVGSGEKEEVICKFVCCKFGCKFRFFFILFFFTEDGGGYGWRAGGGGRGRVRRDGGVGQRLPPLHLRHGLSRRDWVRVPFPGLAQQQQGQQHQQHHERRYVLPPQPHINIYMYPPPPA
jgi:hypothetical protein